MRTSAAMMSFVIINRAVVTLSECGGGFKALMLIRRLERTPTSSTLLIFQLERYIFNF